MAKTKTRKTKTKPAARPKASRTAARKAPAKRPARKPAAKKAPAKRSSTARVRAAARLYQSFHEEAPRQVQRVAHRDVKEAMALGRLDSVTYQTPDGKLYRHRFIGAARPILAASHDGRQLVVLGGRYRMTWRGIVDQRK
jgi:hypothetical protein